MHITTVWKVGAQRLPEGLTGKRPHPVKKVTQAWVFTVEGESAWKSLWNQIKMTELLLVQKGGGVLHWGLWKRAGRSVCLSTWSTHTPGPTHRPVIMWPSTLFRVVYGFQFGVRRSSSCSTRTAKQKSHSEVQSSCMSSATQRSVGEQTLAWTSEGTGSQQTWGADWPC